MKTSFPKRTFLFLIMIFLLSGTQACKKIFPPPRPQLPPETQEGNNTFGCLVNGNVWRNECKLFLFCSPTLKAYYGRGRLSINATKVAGEAGKDNTYIRIDLDSGVFSPGTFRLAANPEGLGSYKLQKDCSYVTDNLNTGTLEITRLDTINLIVSGRFGFTAADPGCGTTAITEGRFDIRYE